MNALDWAQIEDLFAELPLREQLLLVERFVKRMRQGAHVAPADFDRQMDAMANDPDVQRELRMLSKTEEVAPARTEGGL